VREAAQLRPEVAIRVERLDEATVNGGALRLQQLLVNVLDSALRVIPANGQVKIELASRTSSNACIRGHAWRASALARDPGSRSRWLSLTITAASSAPESRPRGSDRSS
jgi:signal transduction histidine kinase